MGAEEDLNPDKGFLDKCQICDGTRRTYNMMPCLFCNETGLSNKFADSFIKNHICLCSRPRLVVPP